MTITMLATRWSQLFPDADEAAVSSCFEELQQHYEESGRHYHTLEHIGDMLAAQQRYFPQATREQVLAIFLHDLVYDARRPDNEERSADLGHTMLTALGVSEVSAAKVTALIQCTKTHTASNAQEQEVCDLDLLSLGLPPSDYQENTKRIREEYAFATDEEWAQGRAEFIDRFLARPSIYATDQIKAAFEGDARRNLDHERSLLKY